jgi:hypothetical protein
MISRREVILSAACFLTLLYRPAVVLLQPGIFAYLTILPESFCRCLSSQASVVPSCRQLLIYHHFLAVLFPLNPTEAAAHRFDGVS